MRYRSLVRAIEPTSEPVTLAEVKLHIRIDNANDDALLTNLIAAARAWAESYCDRTFCFTQWTLRTDSFYGNVGSPSQFGLKADGNNIEGRANTVPNLDVELPRPPMVTSGTATSVSVSYTPNVSGTTATLSSSEFRIDRFSTPGALRPNYGGTWPSHLLDQNSISVSWYAGYSADGTSVPAQVKAALLMIVSHLWSNRELASDVALIEIPVGVKAMLDSIRWGAYQ